jgi:hypothetical protein
MDRENIERELHAALEKSRDTVSLTRDEFSFRLSRIPTGIRAPDGPGYIQQAGQAYHTALRGYIASLRRLNQFLVDGKLPKETETADS